MSYQKRDIFFEMNRTVLSVTAAFNFEVGPKETLLAIFDDFP